MFKNVYINEEGSIKARPRGRGSIGPLYAGCGRADAALFAAQTRPRFSGTFTMGLARPILYRSFQLRKNAGDEVYFMMRLKFPKGCSRSFAMSVRVPKTLAGTSRVSLLGLRLLRLDLGDEHARQHERASQPAPPGEALAQQEHPEEDGEHRLHDQHH